MGNIVYIATSLDGYIATKDGNISWLTEIPNPTGSDYGFSDFMKNIDALIMGRNTYETVLGFGGEWPYSRKVFVLSNSLKELDTSLINKAEIINGDLKNIIRQINESGFKNLYIDGGKTIQAFLNEGLIDELILTQIPIILGAGIPLFGPLGHSVKLEHCSTEVLGGGMVKSHYKKGVTT